MTDKFIAILLFTTFFAAMVAAALIANCLPVTPGVIL
jgi:hypothetical protein